MLMALKAHDVTAEVVDLDHYRIHGGMAVETDYIVSVEPKSSGDAVSKGSLKKNNKNQTEDLFDAFTLSKSYSAFRTLAAQLKKAADAHTGSLNSDDLPRNAVKAAKYCELVSHLIESQKTQYLGKVNYMYVKVLAKQRSQIINDVLEATCSYFPDDPSEHQLLTEVASIIETFFLTDHCEAINPGENTIRSGHHKKLSLSSIGSLGKEKSGPLGWLGGKSSSKELGGKTGKGSADRDSRDNELPTPRSSMVVPMTRKSRRSIIMREQDEKDLNEVGEDAQLLMDDDRPQIILLPSYSKPAPVTRSGGSKLGDLLDRNPLIFLAISLVAVYLVHKASLTTVSLDGDIALLIIFATFCLGLHTPRPMMGGYDQPPTMKATMREPDKSGRRLLRRSMAITPRASAASAAAAAGAAEMFAEVVDDDEEEEEAVLGSPLPRFPEGAKIGTVNNCWSEPEPENFMVRGPNYLSDKKKIQSGKFIFPSRGIDLFLTDTCPENVGSNSSVFGGSLREKPTFIINFRLPWGVLLFYFEIPERFLPFIKAQYEEGFDKSKLPSLNKMTPADRTVSRFLMGSADHKNQTLKIVPVVVDGPWVVKQVVGGKPAILGTKVPVNYVYQPAEGNKAMYLEADLDVAAASAARGILSVTRSYTNVLTLDLGFVIQGNTQDELPEQMLVGARIHGVDPLTAPSLPPMLTDLFPSDATESDDASITPAVSPVVMARE